MRPHLAVMPDVRHTRALRLGGDEVVQFLPKRRQIEGREPVIELLPFGRARRYRFHRHRGSPYSAASRRRSPRVKPILSRSASSAADCASLNGDIGGGTPVPFRSLWESAAGPFKAGPLGEGRGG